MVNLVTYISISRTRKHDNIILYIIIFAAPILDILYVVHTIDRKACPIK